MIEGQNPKQYDLEDRTFQFAKRVRVFVKMVPRTIGNLEDTRQLVKASGSIGSNYIEANEALSKKDFVMRIKISRKEAKEARYWLSLLDTGTDLSLDKERGELVQEGTELMKDFRLYLEKERVSR